MKSYYGTVMGNVNQHIKRSGIKLMENAFLGTTISLNWLYSPKHVHTYTHCTSLSKLLITVYHL